MTLFEQVKECVTARQAVEHYGIKVKRNGMACCPFHKDRHPSMKADKIYHCFACGVGGDAIDFTARLFGISQYEAAKKMVKDFGLDIKVGNRSKYKKTHQSRDTLKSEKPKVVMIREKLEQWLKHATDVLIRYLKWIQFWKEFYRPEPDEEWHELFTEALANERKINDYLDVLMFGTGEEIVEFFKMKRREVEKIEEMREKYDDLAVVCYINSTAELKCHSDVCVTSSNAVKIVKSLPNKNIFFIPDENLGRHVAKQIPEKNIILNKGFCHVHVSMTADNLKAIKEKYPKALVLAHPECKQEVLDLADYIGSTSGIINYATESDNEEFIICTESGVGYELRTKNPNKKFYFAGTKHFCPNMKLNTVEKVCHVLKTGENEVHVSDETRLKSLVPLDKMLEMAK